MNGTGSRLLTWCALALAPLALQADDWPQWLGPQRDGVWRESGIVERFPADGPAVVWRTEIGAGYSGPAVAEGRVYVMDRQLDRGAANPDNAFDRGSIPGRERVLCLRESDGRLLWSREYDCAYTVSYASGPRCTPLISSNRVYALGAEGNLHSLDTETGRVVWSKDFKTDYRAKTPTWGFAGHPLLHGNKLICLVGGEGSLAVAFEKETGTEIWRTLEAKEPGYAPPTLIEHHGRAQLILWHPESVNAVDPEDGRLLWTVPFESRAGLSVSTPRLEGDRLFITTFYNGSLLLRLGTGTPEILWQSRKVSEKDTTELHSIIPTPFLESGHVYGVCSYGQLRCLKLDTGERVWETLAATTPERETRWANAFLVKHADRFFLFNERGELILARLTPRGYEEISRARLLEPTNRDPGRPVVWSHPAFANRRVYVRNDRELVCASLAKP